MDVQPAALQSTTTTTTTHLASCMYDMHCMVDRVHVGAHHHHHPSRALQLLAASYYTGRLLQHI
jgi:hypothetical protein